MSEIDMACSTAIRTRRTRALIVITVSALALFPVGPLPAQQYVAGSTRSVSLKGFSLPALALEIGLFVPSVQSVQAGRSASIDPSLYLSRDQVVRLLPVVKDFAENPYPSPRTARGALSTIDSVLSDRQQKVIAELEARLLASRSGSGSAASGGSGRAALRGTFAGVAADSAGGVVPGVTSGVRRGGAADAPPAGGAGGQRVRQAGAGTTARGGATPRTRAANGFAGADERARVAAMLSLEQLLEQYLATLEP